MCILSGAAGGFVGTAWAILVSGPLLRRAGMQASGRESTAAFLQGAALYAASGAAAGLLFWLAWGLPAIVNLPWPAVGLAYGGLVYCAGVLPLLGLARLRLGQPLRFLAVVALEWLVACAAIGQLCALAWHRAG
jgi:hypothetical protein